MQKIKHLVILFSFSLTIILLEIFNIISVGYIINKFFPCTQNPTNSLPCYIKYDIQFLFFLGSFSLVILILIIAGLLKKK